MITIAPAILARDVETFTKRLQALQKGNVSVVQLDVIDNSLIAGQSIADIHLIESLRGSIRFEIHLMVDLMKYDLTQWNKPWVDRIIVHVESEGHELALPLIRSWKIPAILACNPETHYSKLEPFLDRCDGVMFMTVEPGAMGNAFRHDVIERMAMFHHLHPETIIEVDGGVTPVTMAQLFNSGATRFAVGSFVDTAHVADRYLQLRSIASALELSA